MSSDSSRPTKTKSSDISQGKRHNLSLTLFTISPVEQDSNANDAKSRNNNQLRCRLNPGSDEHTFVLHKFQETMQQSNSYSQIIVIEQIHNETWLLQYEVQRNGLFEQLKKDTEQFLFHGCADIAVENIIKRGFDRNRAGEVHGTSYGRGVYFSRSALESHGYTKANQSAERHMFLTRVLVGNTMQGNSSVKYIPDGYHTTSNGKDIFVTYHDSQAYAAYLIVYK
ncbi:unnamed protein product [Didymodactylos carnosus]|uniref:Poly [ADP-ribose] polymerase n=1 Tax=Didymodactylos carnosus TaxID=1234261 RepID=A0A8S2FBX1_9BILA|nr:unnamed protein product [Didymodactylos carnosus]CAF4219315.1 unnamed protein product [Didymodactylos carnosus]